MLDAAPRKKPSNLAKTYNLVIIFFRFFYASPT